MHEIDLLSMGVANAPPQGNVNEVAAIVAAIEAEVMAVGVMY